MWSAVFRSRKHHANGHAFGQVVDGYCKGKHSRLRQVRAYALRLVGSDMWCGVSSSICSRKPMPNRKPTAAGITDHAPLSASISIAGMSNDHTFFIAYCILPNYFLDLMLMYILPSTTFSTAKLVLEFHTGGTGVSLMWYRSVT